MAERLIEFILSDPYFAWLAFSRFIIVMVICVCLVLLIQVGTASSGLLFQHQFAHSGICIYWLCDFSLVGVPI